MFVFCASVLLGLALPCSSCNGFPAAVHAADAGDRIHVEGEGEAEVVRQDLLGARRTAMERAKRAAFSRALEEAAPSPVALSKQQELFQELAQRLDEFLIQYRFDEMQAAGVVFVTVHAVFSMSALQEEFAKRGWSAYPGAAERPADEVFILVRGVRSAQSYSDVLEELPRRVEGLRSLVPYEIFLDELTLKASFAGDPDSFARSVRRALTEIVPVDFSQLDGAAFAVFRAPPKRADGEPDAVTERPDRDGPPAHSSR